MKTSSRARIIISFILVLFHVQVAAQQPAVSAALDRNRIYLGDQFTLTIQVKAGLGKGPVLFPILPDSLNHLEVVNRKAVDSIRAGSSLTYTQEIVMTSFDSGRWAIPSLVVSVNGRNFKTEPLPVAVMSIPLRGNDYNDIKEIIPVNDGGVDWKKWLMVLAIGLLVVLGAYYWWERRQRVPPVVPQVSRATAYDEAIGALKKIQQEKLHEKGEIKTYYSSIYDVFRLYLARVSGKPFMQFTTDEILMSAKEILPPGLFGGTAEVMRITDAVKFAKYQSHVQESTDALERIKQGIEEINRQKRSL
jgi:hypothetical protein